MFKRRLTMNCPLGVMLSIKSPKIIFIFYSAEANIEWAEAEQKSRADSSIASSSAFTSRETSLMHDDRRQTSFDDRKGK